MALKQRLQPIGLLAEHWIAGGIAASIYGMAVAAMDLARLEVDFSIPGIEYVAVPFLAHEPGGGWLVFADGPFQAVPPPGEEFRGILGATGPEAVRLDARFAAAHLLWGAHAQSAQGPSGPMRVKLSHRWESICLGQEAGWTQTLTP